MKTMIVKFVCRDEEVVALDHELRQSQLLNEWPVVVWAVNDSTPAEIEWFKREYKDED